MRFSIYIPRTTFGLFAAILAGLVIAAVLWFGLFGAPSFNGPSGSDANYRDEEALVITIIATLGGGSWIGTRLERWRLSQPTLPGLSARVADQRRRRPTAPARGSAPEALFKETADRLIAEAVTRQQQADALRRSAWFGASVIDLDAARRRAGVDGPVGLGRSFLDMPNPYFVLPVEAIVKWGFATPSQVTSAYMMAADGTAPVKWRNSVLMRDLGYMGWGGTESVARIGLFLESLDRPNRTKPD